MASKTQAQRFINVINQQMDILKGERETVLEAVDDAINQVQSEVDAWVNGGLVNETTYAQMNNIIQKAINLFIVKSVEISDIEIKENESDLNQTTLPTSNDSKIIKTSQTKEKVQERTLISIKETGNKAGVYAPHVTTTRFELLEEAVLSLERTTEQVQAKQENFNKKLEILINANLKSKKRIQERLTLLEKTGQDISSNVDELFENVTKIDVNLKRLEEENKYVIALMNELNEGIGIDRGCRNDVIMAIQDLSKSIEITDQHYNEMSDKMSLNKEKDDDLIGMVCQLLSKRLAPLETLNGTFNKKVIFGRDHISKIKFIDTQLAEISGKVTEIESTFNQPTLLFNAYKSAHFDRGSFNLEEFTDVSTNHGRHFDPSSGQFMAPLSGFYLISIHAIRSSAESFNVKCFQDLKNLPSMFCYLGKICSVSNNNECVTCIVELEKGEMVWLRLESKVNDPLDLIRIQFSCFMIK